MLYSIFPSFHHYANQFIPNDNIGILQTNIVSHLHFKNFFKSK